jgi:hypothetical protein
MSDDPKGTWVQRVLGVRLPRRGAQGGFGQASGRWRDARADVAARLAEFRAALLAHDAIKADPRARFVAAAAAEIPRMLPAPPAEIEALLESRGASKEGAGKALAAIATYRSALDNAAALARLEAFASRSLNIPLAVRETLTTALDEIEAALRTAA